MLLLRGGGAATLLAVVGPGLLAGLSDDDPAGIATYSILGAKYGYEMLWVLTLSTAALIGFFVVVACAATLHVQGIEIEDTGDAARALEPLAGDTAATLFGLGFLGAALLAAAIVPLSTAYSLSEALGRKADLDDSFAEARTFYLGYAAVVAAAAALVLIPGVPLIDVLFLSQALNAILLLVILPFLRSLGRDRELMGVHALSPTERIVTGIALAAIAISVIALGVLAVL